MSRINQFCLFIGLSLTISCNSQNENSSGGVVLYKKRFLNQQTNSFVQHPYERDRKVFYMDSMIIGEGSHVNIETNLNGKQSIETFVGEYTFIDLRTRSFYEYANFSDTAQIIDQYIQPDSGRNKRGWDFLTTESIFNLKTLEELSDTTIDQIRYKRIKSHSLVEVTNPEEQKLFGKEHLQVRVGYMRCDLENIPFSMDKILFKKYRCPVMRLDLVTPSNNALIVTERVIVSDKLTEDEIRVFEAWKRNAQSNPVIK